MSFIVYIADKENRYTNETFVTLDDFEAQAKNFSIIAINEVGMSRPMHYFPPDSDINRVLSKCALFKVIATYKLLQEPSQEN